MEVTAAEWDGVWVSKGILHRILNKARAIFTMGLYKKVFKFYLSKSTMLLEVGCGSSTTSLYLAQYLKGFVGLDFSDEALKISREKAKELHIKNARLVKGNAFKMPFKNDSFDVVWSQGLLEHFDNPREILTEKIRVCKKGGIVITIVPGAWSFNKLWYVLTRPRLFRNLWPWTEQLFYTKRMLRRLADDTPVKIIRLFYFHRYGVLIQIMRKR